MVCCALLAGLIGLLLSPIVKMRASRPLEWRPGAPDDRRPGPLPAALAARRRSFGFAWAGLRFVVSNEANMRLHLFAALLALALGFLLDIAAQDWRWIVLAILLVIAAETFNTAIEQACNALSGRSEAIRNAKDAAAGAVLLCAIGALLIGATVFAPPIWRQVVAAGHHCG